MASIISVRSVNHTGGETPADDRYSVEFADGAVEEFTAADFSNFLEVDNDPVIARRCLIAWGIRQSGSNSLNEALLEGKQLTWNVSNNPFLMQVFPAS